MDREAVRTCIITGANAGIGKSAALQLAAQGLRVVLACRNLPAAEAVCAEIQRQTGNSEVFARRVDLALAADIRRFCREYIDEFGALDVLNNNAADFDISRKQPLITAEGNEAQFAANLLAPFLLMRELLPLLKQSADGRILNISSQGLVTMPGLAFDFDNTRAEKGYSSAKTYYQTKLGLLMLSLALRRREGPSGVSVYAVRVPNVKVDLARYPDISPVLKAMYRLKSNFAISPHDMAEAYTALAAGERLDGFYYDEKLREVRCNKSAYDEAAQEKLWAFCEQRSEA